MSDDASIEKILKDYETLLNDLEIKSLSQKLDKYQNPNNTQSLFNIFTAISETYYKENLHSDILSCILDPKTDKIGNIAYLHAFIDFLNEHSKKINRDDFDKSTEVKREEGRIDILIRNDASKKAIIIENKINNAADQKDQLARYYKTVKEEWEYKVVAIVYLTLMGGKPSYDYSKEYKRYEEEIKKLTIPVCAIHNTANLADNFLPQCIKNTNTSELSKVFISQYQELLHIRGGNFMSQKLLEKLFKDEKSLNTAKHIANVWEKRQEIITNILWKKIKLGEIKVWRKYTCIVYDLNHIPKNRTIKIYFDDEWYENFYGKQTEKWKNGWIAVELYKNKNNNNKPEEPLQSCYLPLSSHPLFYKDDVIKKVNQCVTKIVTTLQKTK